MKYDYLIVGSGLFGAVMAYRLRQAGKRCIVIDKRPHIGGNVYCEQVEGINVHKYGAHIFHTSDKAVWDFVNEIVPFNRYTHSPVAVAPDGRLYNLPFNMNTFYQMWHVATPEQAQAKIEAQRAGYVAELQRQGIVEPRNLEEQAISLIGRDLYEKLIQGYTEKQWGRKCTELPAFIINRLPVRFVFDNNYFNDTYQGIPIGGYTALVEKLLDGVEVRLNTDYFTDRAGFDDMAGQVVFTGEIDRYFDYRFGRLEYRTVRFETELLEGISNYQGNAVVNYTDAEIPYTRIIEHKHFESFGAAVYEQPHTIISREYPAAWHPGCEPCYPVNDTRNNGLYSKYLQLAKRQSRVIFGGRLAEYKYYDMHHVIANALAKAERLYRGLEQESI